MGGDDHHRRLLCGRHRASRPWTQLDALDLLATPQEVDPGRVPRAGTVLCV